MNMTNIITFIPRDSKERNLFRYKGDKIIDLEERKEIYWGYLDDDVDYLSHEITYKEAMRNAIKAELEYKRIRKMRELGKLVVEKEDNTPDCANCSFGEVLNGFKERRDRVRKELKKKKVVDLKKYERGDEHD
jgi:hypothetical protein